MRQNDTVIVGDRRISTIENIVVCVSPAEESADQIAERVAKVEAMDDEGFVLGVVNFEILMDCLRELDQDIPLEIGLSRGNTADGARLLRIRHGQTKIYIAGRTRLPSSEYAHEPDALDAILAENVTLKKRIAVLREQLNPATVSGMGDDP